jgi:ABC-type metal ion transport system substrate-binding protein
VQHFFQTHPRFQSHREEHLEEPSKIHQQTLNPFAYYSAICHLQDIERPISVRVENNETDAPMFRPLVLLYSYGIYTNAIKLNCIKDSKLSNSLNLQEEPNEISQTRLASIISFYQRREKQNRTICNLIERVA